MSHFAVLVIGPDVEKQLQPYHQFECTGTSDQYVQDIDETEERRQEYQERTRTMVKCPDGTLVSAYDGRFQKRVKEDGDVFTRTEYIVPEGHERLEVKASEIQTFAEWLSDYHNIKLVPFGLLPDTNEDHKYGYAILDEAGEVTRVINRTNPNYKWDWWVEGGRWSGFLKLKQGADGALGRKGLMGSCANDGPGRADVALKGSIDFDGMRQEAGAKASERWEKARAALTAAGAPITWDTWEHLRDVTHKGDIESARQAYSDQPSVKAIKAGFADEGFWIEPDEFLVPHEVYTQRARDRATVLYAFVKDGQWVGKGEMGWFGMSSGDEDQDAWNRKVNEMLDALPDDTLITVVDCHI
jgi:hypothetical protein